MQSTDFLPSAGGKHPSTVGSSRVSGITLRALTVSENHMWQIHIKRGLMQRKGEPSFQGAIVIAYVY